MNIQHFSIVVPNKKCANNCPFCVSRMLGHDYENLMDINHPHYDINVREYLKRMEFVANNGCNTADYMCSVLLIGESGTNVKDRNH